MIVKRMPKGITKEVVSLSKFFSNKDNTVYPIQFDLQRPYCWPSHNINKFFKDYIIDLYDQNKDADEAGEDDLYATIGDAILTSPEYNYGVDGKCKKQEIIDGSQRITTSMAIVAMMIMMYLDNNFIISEDERRKIYNQYFKTKNGLSYKIISTYRDNDFIEVIEDCIAHTFDTDNKTIKSFTKVFNEPGKKNVSVYKSFRQTCYYVYSLIVSTIGIDNVTIKDRLDLFLERTYIHVEECAQEERMSKFLEVNTCKEGVANKDVYKTQLCAKGSEIDKKFQEFERKVKMITVSKHKRINIIKLPITPMEYIMRMSLILMDKTRKICKSSFSLDDEKNGFEYHINNGLLTNEHDIFIFLDKCIDICNFLYTSMDYKQDGFNEEWYLLAEYQKTCKKENIWLYNILPSYVISHINDDDKKSFAFEMLFKSYIAYSIKYSTEKSVQYIQDYMYTFTRVLLEKSEKEYSLDDFKESIKTVYNNTFGDLINNDIIIKVQNLNYLKQASRPAINNILSCIEYFAQKHSGKKRDNLYNLIKKDVIEMEHIFPQSKMSDTNKDYIHGVGDLTFLEKALNASKQDNETSTSDRFGDSSFITTKLMIKGNRYEGIINPDIKHIQENIIPLCVDKETINNFESSIIIRRDAIAHKIKEILS
jgi:hypothetical protein